MKVYFDITNRCNKACPPCPVKDRDFPQGDMDIGLFKSVVDQLSGGTVLDLHQSGEPLLHPDIGEMIRYGKKKKMTVETTTNGLLLKDRIEDLDGIDSVTVSLMDTSPVMSVKKFLDSRKNGSPTVFVKGFLKEGLTVTDSKLTGGMIYGGTKVAAAWSFLLASGGEQKIGQIQDTKVKHFTDKPCPKVKDEPVVTWDGYMLLCCRDFFRKTITGDLNKEPFDKVFKYHKVVYEEQKKGNFTGLCYGCNHIHRDNQVWKLVALNRKAA